MRLSHARLASAILAGLFAAAACTSAASPSPTTTPTASAATIPIVPSPAPSPTPGTTSTIPIVASTAPSPTPGTTPTFPIVASPSVRVSELAVGGRAQVITDNLRRRSKPRVGSDAVILGAPLQSGAGLWILDGPVAGSGYVWYRVALADPTSAESTPDRGLGWVASADRDGARWIEAQPFARTVPAGSLVWSSSGDESAATEANFELGAGAPHFIFSGVEDCIYRVRFGTSLEFDLGFRGAQLSTVQWPSGPEPSMATSGQGTTVTAMPSLPAGSYRLEVSNHGAPMLEAPTSLDYPCPWGLAITP